MKNKKSTPPYSVFGIFRYSRLGIRYFNNRGFTIIETLVAIAILLLSIIAPLTIAERGLAAAEAARQEITAFYLAQEAIEYVRSVRDANAIAGKGGGANWLQGLQACEGGKTCGIDVGAAPGTQAVACGSSNSDCALYQYVGTEARLQGLFGHRTTGGWVQTHFTRTVALTELQDNIEANVRVTVAWRAGSQRFRTLEISENILNWYDSP